MQTDPIADFITRMRNANRAGSEQTTLPSSKLKKAIAAVLANHDFLEKFEEKDGTLTVVFKQERPALELKRVSKPGQRIYVGHNEIFPVKSVLGAAIISTSQGILIDKEARKRKLGGELLFTVF